MPPGAVPDIRSRRAAWHRNLVELFAALARAYPSGSAENVGGVTLARTGAPSSSFNCAVALDLPVSLEGLEDRIEAMFVRSGTPWHIVATPETAPLFEGVAQRFHLTERIIHPGLAWRPLPDTMPPAPEGFDIRVVQDTREAREFGRTSLMGFGLPTNLFDPWLGGMFARGSAARRLHGVLYVGYVGDRPVATSMRFTSGDIAGIYVVATLPEFRRRGYASALTYRAALDGRE